MAVSRRTALARCFAMAGCFALAGCGTTQSVHVRARDRVQFAPWIDAPTLYRLGAGDRLRVDFLLTPEMGQEAVVEPDGAIALRAAPARIRAQNLTPAELTWAVERASLARLRNPMVTVSVLEAKSARVVVGGAVARPGAYPLPARASVLEAVMLAGGFDRESRMDEVVIIRRRADGLPMLTTVDLRAFVARAAPAGGLPLAPEDIVFVPRTRAAEAGLWVEQNIDRLLPFTGVFNFGQGR